MSVVGSSEYLSRRWHLCAQWRETIAEKSSNVEPFFGGCTGDPQQKHGIHSVIRSKCKFNVSSSECASTDMAHSYLGL